MTTGALARGTCGKWSPLGLSLITSGEETDNPFIIAIQKALAPLRISIIHVSKIAEEFDSLPMRMLELFCASCIQGKGMRLRTLEFAIRQARTRHRKVLIEGVLNDAAQRKIRSGGTLFLLEPDLQLSPGALADYRALEDLSWIISGDVALTALPETGLLSPQLADQLQESHEFLRSLLYEMQLLCDSPEDQLKFGLQLELSAALGYTAAEHSLPEEQLLRDYYRHASRVDTALSRCTMALREVRRSINGTISTLYTGYPVRQNTVVLDETSPGFAPNDPTWLMPLFATVCRHGLEFEDHTQAYLEAVSAGISDNSALATPQNLAAFGEILGNTAHGARVLRLMHKTGFLEAYLPEFRLVRHLPRIDHYHQFTLDEHMLRTVEAAHNLRDPSSPLAGTHAATICQEVLRHDLLVMAALLHDTGKGEGRGHVFRGARLIEEAGTRIGLRTRDIEFLRSLVLHHHRMSHIALKQDPDNESVAEELADDIRYPELLRMLYVLTVCDLRSVSKESWNEWRGALLADLYEKSAAILRKRLGIEEPVELRHSMVVRILSAVRESGSGDKLAIPTVDGSNIVRFVKTLPEAYRIITPEKHVARHMALANLITLDRPLNFELEHEESGNFLSVHVVSKDCPGLLHQLVCAFGAAKLEMIAFHAFSTTTGIAVDIFHFSLPTDLSAAGDLLQRELEKLQKFIKGGVIPSWEEMVPDNRDPVSLARLLARPVEVKLEQPKNTASGTILQVSAPWFPEFLRSVLNALDKAQMQTLRGSYDLDSYQAILTLHLSDWEKNPVNLQHAGKKLKHAVEQAVTPPRTVNSSAAIPKLVF
ncbi:MAG: HD domain-containing protein [Candidatus Sumerlaeia bacterium]|nr:HD domain-containing protein [Candidatus Sumerlaeia bacterium]